MYSAKRELELRRGMPLAVEIAKYNPATGSEQKTFYMVTDQQKYHEAYGVNYFSARLEDVENSLRACNAVEIPEEDFSRASKLQSLPRIESKHVKVTEYMFGLAEPEILQAPIIAIRN